MTPSNVFQPVWPPASQDDFSAWPEVREARKMYEAQKLGLRGMVDQAQRLAPGADAIVLSRDIAAMLHNLSGTAAHFGESALGSAASELEQPVRVSFNAGLLHPLCSRILALLDPAGG